jgi:DNA-binding NarL/FixJ family response regulator
MSTIAVIDLQPLFCMGIQAYLQQLDPGCQCPAAFTRESTENLMTGPAPDLLILGFNKENQDITSWLTEKVRTSDPGLPVILLYDIFDPRYLTAFANRAANGLLAKDNAYNHLARCITTVLSGGTYMCETSSQHVIDAFVSPTRKQVKSKKK